MTRNAVRESRAWPPRKDCVEALKGRRVCHFPRVGNSIEGQRQVEILALDAADELALRASPFEMKAAYYPARDLDSLS
jgi:hypothetical protein